MRTHIGYGSTEQDSFKAHGSPLGAEGVRAAKRKLGWPAEPDFLIPDQALTHFREAVADGARAQAAWDQRFSVCASRYFQTSPRSCAAVCAAQLPPGWDADIPGIPGRRQGPRHARGSGRQGDERYPIAPKLPALTGGSADLDASTKTALKGQGDFNPPATKDTDQQGSDGGGWSYAGRNVHFGVREHAMGAIVNGLAAHGGFVPYDATFLIFSDYMRPPIRLAALMGLHLVHVFTHDSLALGEVMARPISRWSSWPACGRFQTWW